MDPALSGNILILDWGGAGGEADMINRSILSIIPVPVPVPVSLYHTSLLLTRKGKKLPT